MVFYDQMIQYLFKHAKHCNCVVNTLDLKNFPLDSIAQTAIDVSCWKARVNKLVNELWYLHKHTMKILNGRFSLSTRYNVTLCIQKFRKRTTTAVLGGGVEKYKHLLDENAPRPLLFHKTFFFQPTTICYLVLSIVWSLSVDFPHPHQPTDEFLKKAQVLLTC